MAQPKILTLEVRQYDIESCNHFDANLVGDYGNGEFLCREPVQTTLDKFLMSLLFPGRSFRYSPINTFSQHGPNQSDWLLGQLWTGRADLTTFSTYVTDGNLKYRQPMIAPWLQSRPTVVHPRTIFQQRPILAANFTIFLFVFVSAAVHWFIERLQRTSKQDIQRHAIPRARSTLFVLKAWHSAIVLGMFQGVIRTIFMHRPHVLTASSSQALHQLLVDWPAVNVYFQFGGYATSLIEASHSDKASWTKIIKSRGKKRVYEDYYAAVKDGERAVLLSTELFSPSFHVELCDLIITPLEDIAPTYLAAFTRLKPTPKLSEPMRIMASDKLERLTREAKRKDGRCRLPPSQTGTSLAQMSGLFLSLLGAWGAAFTLAVSECLFVRMSGVLGSVKVLALVLGDALLTMANYGAILAEGCANYAAWKTLDVFMILLPFLLAAFCMASFRNDSLAWQIYRVT